MMDNKDYASKDPDVYHHLSEAYLQHQMARRIKKTRRPVETCRTGTSGPEDCAEEEGLDRAHSQKTSFKLHATSPDMEPSGKGKRGSDLARAGSETLKQSREQLDNLIRLTRNPLTCNSN